MYIKKFIWNFMDINMIGFDINNFGFNAL